MYKLNNILLSTYGIIPSRVPGEGIAVKGIFDLPKRIGDTRHDWAEESGVEPYVDADEIFLGARQLLFQGFIIGDVATIKANLTSLNSDIEAYTDLVPFETPYGNACVKVKKITPKFYRGGAIIQIELVEPQVGASCGVSVPPTIYYSAEYSEDADKNNCQEGYHGSTETFTAEAGKFNSTVSQNAADLLAVQWVRENKQNYANATGSCIVNPPVYYNVKLTGNLQKDDCGSGLSGSTVEYVVDAFKYSSLISQEDADAQAQAEIDSNLTQAYANENGTCAALFYNPRIGRILYKNDCSTGFEGSQEVYIVEAGVYSSNISQEDADAQAYADLDANAQNYANENGTCSFIGTSTVTKDFIRSLPRGVYEGVWTIGNEVKRDSIFSFIAYGVDVRYFAQEGDTGADVVQALITAINSKTKSFWNSDNQYPTYSNYDKPYASVYGSDPLKISVKVGGTSSLTLVVNNDV
ncbi:DUF5977 domain-containing protein [Aestuariibaculum marinum]|uniref:DUF5977 domain-containing protein n=1 Tax=Aestuariibaculum marinum TaxID=2683592 RepID=A0A8J6Q6T5_9FLAO|nr:DUF5977 domain-containing protein [Aestuariibaculum marinum]MBD0822651.1 hypothetical protein [Aestuariibaculum marinum]